jgi:hypothetical protein
MKPYKCKRNGIQAYRQSEMLVVVMIAVQHNAAGAKGHYFKETYKTRRNFVIDVNLTNKLKSAIIAEERVRTSQRKLYSKAKREKERVSENVSFLARTLMRDWLSITDYTTSQAGSVDEPVKAWKELCRKAVCGKTACTV